MRRTFAGFVLPLATSLSLLAVPTPGKAVAGPPEGASGKMVLDKVANGLRKYHQEKDGDKCIALLERLAPTLDPRVAIVMGEWCENEQKAGLPPGVNTLLFIAAQDLLTRYYVPAGQLADDWWEANKADLRRRAKQLPR